jgi:hypothetical protein
MPAAVFQQRNRLFTMSRQLERTHKDAGNKSQNAHHK